MIIDGTVTDPSGRPVAGAAVLIASSPTPVPDIAALTGEDGRFSITVPVPGAYRLTARSAAGTVEVAVDVAPTGAGLDIELPG